MLIKNSIGRKRHLPMLEHGHVFSTITTWYTHQWLFAFLPCRAEERVWGNLFILLV